LLLRINFQRNIAYFDKTNIYPPSLSILNTYTRIIASLLRIFHSTLFKNGPKPKSTLKLKKEQRSIDDKYEMIRLYESIESREWALEKRLRKNLLLIMLLI